MLPPYETKGWGHRFGPPCGVREDLQRNGLMLMCSRHYIETSPEPLSPSITANLLGQLLPLTNLPRKPVDLNAFYIPSLSEPPSDTSSAGSSRKRSKSGKLLPASASDGKKSKSKSKDKEPETTPDWMAAFDDDESDSEEGEAGNGKRGRERERTSKLNILASIHSVPAHTSAYTDLWLSVLGRLQLDPPSPTNEDEAGTGGAAAAAAAAAGWTRKILVGLHGSSGILSHMRPDKRVRVADWLGALVDQGGVKGMLAINGLFVLMTQYNL